MSGPPAKKAKKDATGGEDGAVDRSILEYMRAQNRPYSLINIFDNMHAPFPKSHMQAALERLVNDKQLIMKEYGAQKFFFCPQNSFGDCSSAATADLEREIADLKNSVNQMSTETARFLADCPQSDEQLRSAKLFAESARGAKLAEILDVQVRIDEYRKRSDAVGEFEAAVNKFGRVLDESNKRKKICNQLLSFFAENLSLSKSELIDELGLELLFFCVPN